MFDVGARSRRRTRRNVCSTGVPVAADAPPSPRSSARADILVADGAALVPGPWSPAEALPDRQGIGTRAQFALSNAAAGVLTRRRANVPVRHGASDVRERIRGRQPDAPGDSRCGEDSPRLLLRFSSRGGGRGPTIHPVGTSACLVRSGSPDVSARDLLLLGGTMRQLAWLAGGFAAGNTLADSCSHC